MHDIKIPDPNKKKIDFEVSHVTAAEIKQAEPGEKVKVNFKNFVELVATHDFEEVMEQHGSEDIILSTNLLTDLANAHQEPDNPAKKIPIYIIVGIIIGIVVTYLLLMRF